MRILINGGFGFLGGRIAQYFISEGHDVLIGTTRNVLTQNFPSKLAKVVQTSWNDPEKLEEICSDVDVIINASGMNAKDCFADPVGAFQVNVVATASIIQAAIKKKVRRFIFLSTVHVYADSLHGVISEQDCPSNLHPYATSNLAAENVVLSAQKNNFIDGIVIRLSNGYGAPMRKDANCWMLLINDLCRQAVRKKKLTLKSAGLQSRNFISIQEICNVMNLLVCNKPLSMNVGDVGPINVGGETSITVLEMAQLVQSRCQGVLGYTPELVVDHKTGPSSSLKLDFKIDRLLSLGFAHANDPKEEIDNLLEYCQNAFSGD